MCFFFSCLLLPVRLPLLSHANSIKALFSCLLLPVRLPALSHANSIKTLKTSIKPLGENTNHGRMPPPYTGCWWGVNLLAKIPTTAERRPLTLDVGGAAEERNEQTRSRASPPSPGQIGVESPSAVPSNKTTSQAGDSVRAMTTEHTAMAAHLRTIGIAEKHVHSITEYLWGEHGVFVPSDLGLLEDCIIADVVEACDHKTVAAIKLRASYSAARAPAAAMLARSVTIPPKQVAGGAAGAAPCDISTDFSSPGAAALGDAGPVSDTILALRTSGISAAAASAGVSGSIALPTPPAAGGFPARASSPSAEGAGASALAQRFGSPQRPACSSPADDVRAMGLFETTYRTLLSTTSREPDERQRRQRPQHGGGRRDVRHLD